MCQIAYQTGVGCYIRPATTVCRLSDILGFFIPSENILFLFAVDVIFSLNFITIFFALLNSVFVLILVSNFSGAVVKEIFSMCVFTESVIDVFLLVL